MMDTAPFISRPKEEIEAIVAVGFEHILHFASTDEFQSVLRELYVLPTEARPQFVVDVLLSAKELSNRGVVAPDDLIIQRSSFGDNRPTLFCVTKKLPPGCAWDKLTITFDN